MHHTQAEQLEILGTWWRFDRYEIAGELIKPALGAKLLMYQPWDLYKETDGQGWTTNPPYSSLFDLVDKIEFTPGAGPLETVVTDNSKKLILDWCNRFGLLGLLPTQLLHVNLPSRWVTREEALVATGQPIRKTLAGMGALLCPLQKTYIRYFSGWKTQKNTAIADYPADLTKSGPLVPTDLVNPNWPKPGALMFNFHLGYLEAKPLSDCSWTRFFPDVPIDESESYPYPPILSPNFWRVYAEPVWDFAQFARRFMYAVQRMDQFHSNIKYSQRDQAEVRDAHQFLNTIISDVNPCLHLDTITGKKSQYWASTSLISSLAMMAVLDLTMGKKPLVCGTCGKVFVSVSPIAQYCSPTCRGTMQMRRQRAKKRSGDSK